MTKKNREGDIYQYDPAHATLGGQFVVASEIKAWGIQGYLLLSFPDNGTLVRYKGRAYVRPTWEEIVRVGRVEWDFKDGETDESDPK